MAWGGLLGWLIAFAGIGGAQLLEGGRLGALLQGPAFLIVFVGTCGAVIVQSGLPTFFAGVRLLRWVLFAPQRDTGAVIAQFQRLATRAKRDGLLALDEEVRGIDDQFARSGLQAAIDGAHSDQIRAVLDTAIGAREQRLQDAVMVWEAAGGYAPTLGILGAVLGLTHVMENLSEPSKLGAGIAVAFVATIYGVGLANLVFLPIAHKLRREALRSVTQLEMVAVGVLAISAGDNHDVVGARMRAFGLE